MITRNKKLVVCGCVKNCGKYLLKNLPKLLELRKIFERVSYVFFENDSSDDTLDILKNFDVEVIAQKNIPRMMRVDILAFGRNQLLDHINTYFAHYDYILMTDMDCVLDRFSYKMIEDIFTTYLPHRWDVLTANSYGKYYDVYALRCEPNSTFPDGILFDCWDMINKGRRCRIGDGVLLQEFVGKYQKIIPDDAPLIPVHSAFGGMGLYKIPMIKNCRYSTKYGCEHVAFHEEMREKNRARIFICPKLKACAEPRHLV